MSEKPYTPEIKYRKGSFGFDLAFLRRYDDLVVLSSEDGLSAILISPRYQGKVFTSTAEGPQGKSFGWVNYPAFQRKPNLHMNAYGGENRLWLGPEGGKFSLFFDRGKSMEYANWKTPAAFDTEAWQLVGQRNRVVLLQKKMELLNHVGTTLKLTIDRTIHLMDRTQLMRLIGLILDASVKAVAYQTHNMLTNTGDFAWTETTGMPCIWMLNMFKAGPETVVVIPYAYTNGEPFEKIATTDYFGKIPEDRIIHTNNAIFYRADGISRGKLGVIPSKAQPVLGSYDKENKVLTLVVYDLEANGKYLNQEWNTDKPVFSGDAVNAYNDGPLENGKQMGAFYELETAAPAAFLKPGETQLHKHSVFHFSGEERSLDLIAQKMLGVCIEQIKKVFAREPYGQMYTSYAK